VSGTGGDVQASRELVAVLNLADKEAQSASTSSSPAKWCCWR
jgi:hypothetical protein